MDTGRTKRILLRGLKLRCLDCGLGPLYRSLFRMHTHCEYCDLIYEREQGYFIGAIYINVIATESLLLGTLLIYGLITGKINQTILTVLIVLALTLPLVFLSSQPKPVAVHRPHSESKGKTHRANGL